jgi:toxin CcdB
MAQYDVHRLRGALLVNCQSDLLDRMETRFVIPLVPERFAEIVTPKLNPLFHVAGERMILLTQQAATVRREQLGAVVDSLSHRSFEITDAIDVLLSGV